MLHTAVVAVVAAVAESVVPDMIVAVVAESVVPHTAVAVVNIL